MNLRVYYPPRMESRKWSDEKCENKPEMKPVKISYLLIPKVLHFLQHQVGCQCNQSPEHILVWLLLIHQHFCPENVDNTLFTVILSL